MASEMTESFLPLAFMAEPEIEGRSSVVARRAKGNRRIRDILDLGGSHICSGAPPGSPPRGAL